MNSPTLRILFLGIIVAGVFPSPAYAYIDPMSGSIILQALIAGLLAALLMVKRFWHGISERCRRIWQRFFH